jgi:hypothetical protein
MAVGMTPFVGLFQFSIFKFKTFFDRIDWISWIFVPFRMKGTNLIVLQTEMMSWLPPEFGDEE